jgi:outer membrane protein assembly factor BamB
MMVPMRVATAAFTVLLAVALAACGGGGHSGGSSGTSAPAITTQPGNATRAIGETATFSVVASGATPLAYQWQKNGQDITGATAASYTTPPIALGDDGASFLVTVSNSLGSVQSNGAVLTVVATPAGSDVVTYKNDVARTGQNLNEVLLTAGNVNVAGFGKLRFLNTDGKVDAQPLYLSGLAVQGAAHNVVFVATENDSVYAFDADTGAVLWQVAVMLPGESPSPMPPYGCSQVSPTLGVTATPVIDRGAGTHGTIYLVAMSQDGAGGSHQRLHALDVTTGAELLGGPKEIAATYPSNGGTMTFDPAQYEERAALLLSQGEIYVSFTSHCDTPPYSGWIMAYSQSTLAQSGVLNVAPNSGGSGPAIWMSGGGPAADSGGNVYLLTANGAFETTLDANGFPNHQDYGNSFLRLTLSGSTLAVSDYFTVTDTLAASSNDKDLGSGGILLLPDLDDSGGNVQHLAVGAGKDGNIYVVSRDSLGKFSSSGNNIWQQVSGALGNGSSGGIWSTPAYFNGSLYYGPAGDNLKAFGVSAAKVSAAPTSRSSATFTYPGTAPAVSANGSQNGIVWAHENSNPAVLHAYDASDLSHELYNSSQAGSGRDNFGAGNKFITPTISDGKVFVGTQNGVAVFGLH